VGGRLPSPFAASLRELGREQGENLEENLEELGELGKNLEELGHPFFGELENWDTHFFAVFSWHYP
jgi:hypothetical protein